MKYYKKGIVTQIGHIWHLCTKQKLKTNKSIWISPLVSCLLLLILGSGRRHDGQPALGVTTHLDLAAVHVLGHGELPPEAARHPDPVLFPVMVSADRDNIALAFDVNMVGLEHRQVKALLERLPRLGYLHVFIPLGNGARDVLNLQLHLLVLFPRDEGRLHNVMVIVVHEAMDLALIHPRGDLEGSGGLSDVTVILVPALVAGFDPHHPVTHRNLHLVGVESV